jgi:hypothetical protein
VGSIRNSHSNNVAERFLLSAWSSRPLGNVGNRHYTNNLNYHKYLKAERWPLRCDRIEINESMNFLTGTTSASITEVAAHTNSKQACVH